MALSHRVAVVAVYVAVIVAIVAAATIVIFDAETVDVAADGAVAA